MEVARDHLVRLADDDDAVDAVEAGEPDALEALRVADEADDRVHGAAGDEGLAARRAGARGDGLDLRLGGVVTHDDDHGRAFSGRGARVGNPRG